MTALVDGIIVAMQADAVLMALLTGGVYSWDVAGRLGISRDNTVTATAYDANGRIQPCALVKSRSETPIASVGAVPETIGTTRYSGVQSVRETIEIWFYQDGGFGTIEAAADRCYSLLHRGKIGDVAVVYTGSFIKTYDELMDAFVIRSTYVSNTVKRYIETVGP